MRVGLLAVCLQYGLYVFDHRSKFTNTIKFKFLLVCVLVLVTGRIVANDLRTGVVSVLKLTCLKRTMFINCTTVHIRTLVPLLRQCAVEPNLR